MTDIDLALERLGQAPVPLELAAIDAAVLSGVARRQQEAALAPRLMALTGAFALGLGIVGGGFSNSDPASAQSLSPFATSDALAPSTLLDFRP